MGPALQGISGKRNVNFEVRLLIPLKRGAAARAVTPAA